MKQKFWKKLYKFILLDLVHKSYFNFPINPGQNDFSHQNLEKYFKDLKFEIKVENKNLLTSSAPTLYYSDHQTSLDILYTLYVLGHKDLYFVSYQHNCLLFPLLKKRIVPVSSRLRAKRWDILGLELKLVRNFETLSDEQACQINRQVPEKVVELLNKNKSVVIFPSGGMGEWRDGIGFIIDSFLEKYPDRKINLQPFKISSFIQLWVVVYGWLWFFGLKLKKKIKIKIGKPFQLSTSWETNILQIKDKKTRAKAIRAFLEKKYLKEFL